MGHRANLILLENNNPRIYYSHWDGNYIPIILYQGLEFCEKYFVGFDEHGWLMDNAWSEGGVLIDKDNKNILFFSVEFLETIALQNAYINYLKKSIWMGWNIVWASKGNVDFAEYLDLMEGYILADGCAPDYYKMEDWNSLIEVIDDDTFKSLVTIIHNKTIIDYVLVGYWTEINFCIAEGEQLKEIIPDIYKISNANQIKEIEIVDVLLIDYDTKQIYACWSDEVDDRHIDAIIEIWEGWTAKRQTKGVSFNFEYTKREKAYTKITEKEFIKHLNGIKLLESRLKLT